MKNLKTYLNELIERERGVYKDFCNERDVEVMDKLFQESQQLLRVIETLSKLIMEEMKK